MNVERSTRLTTEDWKTYLGGGFEGEPIEVVVFCPGCAAYEFGDGS